MRECLSQIQFYYQENRAAANWLLFIDERKKELCERRERAANIKPAGLSIDAMEVPIFGNMPSNPTLKRVQYLDEITKMERSGYFSTNRGIRYRIG